MNDTVDADGFDHELENPDPDDPIRLVYDDDAELHALEVQVIESEYGSTLAVAVDVDEYQNQMLHLGVRGKFTLQFPTGHVYDVELRSIQFEHGVTLGFARV